MRRTIIALLAVAVSRWGDLSHADENTNQPPKAGSVATQQTDRVDITCQSGLVFRNCRITRVEPDGLSVAHSKGIAKIDFADLPADYQSKYGYDPQRAAAYSLDASQRRATAFAQQQELAKREQERAQYEASHKEAIDKIKKSATELVGKIQQITQDGALISDAVIPYRYAEEVVTPGYKPMGLNQQFETRTKYVPVADDTEFVFVIGGGKDLTDGAPWQAVVYSAGTYKYKSVLGAARTVKCFALSPQDALDHLLNSD